jgi:predicted nuclease of restriction endonuclease-like RecB superfamily
VRREVEVVAASRASHADARHVAKPGAHVPPRALWPASRRPPSRVSVLDETDLAWIGEAIELLEQHLGKPWRAVHEAFDDLPSSRRQLAAVRGALARVTGSAGKLTAMARRVRGAVLGAPVLDDAARAARIATAAQALGIEATDLDSLLFMDLRGERPIAFPNGRPNELEIASIANVFLIQRALRRAQRLTLTLHGDDGIVFRAALARGLLVTASCAEASMTLDLVGPLALFSRTAIYGRALGQLVPLLPAAAYWQLELEAPGWMQILAAPVLLPKPPPDRAGTYHPRKLARKLAELDRDLQIVVGPSPLTVGSALVCPDLALDGKGARRYVELVGFWTSESLRAKLALYTDAGVSVVLCIEDSRGCGEEPAIDDPRILRYERSLDAREVLQRLTRGLDIAQRR